MFAHTEKLMRTFGVMLLLALSAGCLLTDKHEIRKVAYDAVKSGAALPPGAVLQPIGNCRVFDGKNAATVDVPFDIAEVSGNKQPRSFTVWVKRIGTRWAVDGFAQTHYPGMDDSHAQSPAVAP